jgi:hypothetical protein
MLRLDQRIGCQADWLVTCDNRLDDIWPEEGEIDQVCGLQA